MKALTDLEKEFYEQFVAKAHNESTHDLAYKFFSMLTGELVEVPLPDTTPIEKEIIEVFIERPSFVYPLNREENFEGSVQLTPYVTGNNYQGVHTETVWQAAYDPQFQSIYAEATLGPVDSFFIGVSNDMTLYLRARYKSNDGMSDWTLPVEVDTPETVTLAEPFLVDVTNTGNEVIVPGGLSTNFPTVPSFKTSPLTNISGSTTHLSTDWTIKDSLDNVILEVLGSEASLTDFVVPMGLLEAEQTYTLSFKYNGDNLSTNTVSYQFLTAESASMYYAVLGDNGYDNTQFIYDEETGELAPVETLDVSNDRPYERFCVNHSGTAMIAYQRGLVSLTDRYGKYQLFVKDTLDNYFDFTEAVQYSALLSPERMERDFDNMYRQFYKLMGWTPDDKYFYLFEENSVLKIFRYDSGDLSFDSKITSFNGSNVLYSDITQVGEKYHIAAVEGTKGDVTVREFDPVAKTFVEINHSMMKSQNVRYSSDGKYLFVYDYLTDAFYAYDVEDGYSLASTDSGASENAQFFMGTTYENNGVYYIPVFMASGNDGIFYYRTYTASTGVFSDKIASTYEAPNGSMDFGGFDNLGSLYLIDTSGQFFWYFEPGNFNTATFEVHITDASIAGLGYRGY